MKTTEKRIAALKDSSTETFIFEQANGKHRFVAVEEDGVNSPKVLLEIEDLSLSEAILKNVLFYVGEWEEVLNHQTALAQKMRESLSTTD